tara:strand:- start:1158 stop:1394 length:237 start_codon:yes stop_codon:yes gene_type:complete
MGVVGIMERMPGTGNAMIEMYKGEEDIEYPCDHHDITHLGVEDYGDGTKILFRVECFICGAIGYREYDVKHYTTEWDD